MIKIPKKSLFVGSLVATMVMIGVNVLSMFPIINGLRTQEVSDAYPNLFTPAGITFSIWGVIYLFAMVFVLFQLFSMQKLAKKDQASLQKINKLYIASCLLNSVWLVAWQFKMFWLSVVIMAALLICLILIMREIRKSTIDRGLRFLLNSTFGFYLGWILVATIANITILLVSAGWGAFGNMAEWWAVAIIAIGAIIGSATIVAFKNIYCGLALIWAYVGILLQHIGSGKFNGEYGNILATVVVSLVLLGVCSLVAVTKNRSMMMKKR